MRAALAALGLALACGFASAAMAALPKPVLPPPVSVPALSAGVVTRPVKLSRAVIAMKDGQVWQYYGGNFACSVSGEEFKWAANNSELNIDRFQAAFSEELGLNGFAKIDSQNLFEESSVSEHYEVGLRITNIYSYICGSLLGPFRDTMLITAEWQVYDPVRREVVARIQTSGGAERPITAMSDVQFVLLEAFRENTRALLANDGFRQIVLGASGPSPTPLASAAAITLVTTGLNATKPISEVPGSVVAVFTGSAMGSGFLISNDGYLLTNQHVVGGATTVRIRWSDGLESAGEVVRVDKRRDVALVKTTPRSGRDPLALRRGAPAVGDAVFAVGTPLDPSLQNTVTKGIVSANRILDGFAYIQSDVSIDHGNSGGPLLDDKGRVLGITVIKIAPDDGQRGLNLFIPIGDALDFLSLKTTP